MKPHISRRYDNCIKCYVWQIKSPKGTPVWKKEAALCFCIGLNNREYNKAYES